MLSSDKTPDRDFIISGCLNCCLCLFVLCFVLSSRFAAQHFRSSDMTLSERFAMYQRKAAEAEMRKPRKSPEIHRYQKPSLSFSRRWQISSYRRHCVFLESLPVDLTALSPLAGESMCHPVLLRGTLTCLRIPRKRATR